MADEPSAPEGSSKSEVAMPSAPAGSSKSANARSSQSDKMAACSPEPSRQTSKQASKTKGNTTSKTKRKVSASATPSESSVNSGSGGNAELLTMLKEISAKQSAMAAKVDVMWNAGETDFDEYDDEEEPGSEYDCPDEPPAKQAKTGDSEDSPGDSKFSGFMDKLRQAEKTGPGVDPKLAEVVNGVFGDGLSEDAYKEFCKQYVRPENCEALTNVKCNQLVWDIVTPKSQAMDVRMQIVQTCLAKAGICFANLADKLQEQDSTVGEIVNGLALLGHGFHHLCLRRRELLKTDLKQDYAHLCSPSVKYSDFLFGNDIEKRVTEIKNLNQVGSKLRTVGRGRGWRSLLRRVRQCR